jgi:hypothetical protein
MTLSTTLVLESEIADFSTDAGNSALIVATKSPRRLAVPFYGLPAEKKKSKKTRDFHSTSIGPPGRERHVTEEAFSTAIRSCYRTVIRRADHRTLYSGCSRRRQANDGLLGPLGARRQQGLDRSRQ